MPRERKTAGKGKSVATKRPENYEPEEDATAGTLQPQYANRTAESN